MRLIKRGLTALLIVFLAIQFIQPTRNSDYREAASEISRQYYVPSNVDSLLRTSCYDCHSNNTRYPWYSNIQPIGWLLSYHVKEGKSDLNFDEFGNYHIRRQKSKLKSIAGSVKDGSMPILSYTWMHKNSKLSAENKKLIINWATSTRDSLEMKK